MSYFLESVALSKQNINFRKTINTMKRDLAQRLKKCAFLSDVLELEEDSLPDDGPGNPDGPANPNDLDDPAYDCGVRPMLEVLISITL
ncbi:unnamed protein product [Euphydryas editha]|uniref:Uncharacterized protein n=1 Tax=Euphydryas editha TaxID=104508 RepID=A0AAU9VC98_EUPED|nr:unnamed protein product [Euphydryas editha]